MLKIDISVIAVVVLLLIVQPTLGSRLSVAPVKLKILPHDNVTILNLRNVSTEPVTVQLDIKHWQQHAGKDDYSETQAVFVVPKIIHLAAEQAQVVRVGLRTAQSRKFEDNYRLFIREVPLATSETEEASSEQLKVRLQLVLPVFILPNEAPVERYRWTISSTVSDKVLLTLFNEGNVHLIATQLILLDRENQVVSQVDGVRYVLPGASQVWEVGLKEEVSIQDLHVQAHVSAELTP